MFLDRSGMEEAAFMDSPRRKVRDNDPQNYNPDVSLSYNNEVLSQSVAVEPSMKAPKEKKGANATSSLYKMIAVGIAKTKEKFHVGNPKNKQISIAPSSGGSSPPKAANFTFSVNEVAYLERLKKTAMDDSLVSA
jgi:hypothetical protein